MSKFSFWVAGWVLTIKSKHFKDFLKISLFPKILSFKLFGSWWDVGQVRQLLHSLCGDNNVGSFHLWWRETMLKRAYLSISLSIYLSIYLSITAQKNEVFHYGFLFSKCNQIRSFLRIWSYLLKKLVMENFILCAVNIDDGYL